MGARAQRDQFRESLGTVEQWGKGGTLGRVRGLLFATLVILGALVGGLMGPPMARQQQAALAAGPRSDHIGVAGNAFPWEPHWEQFQTLLDESHAGWARVEIRWEMLQPSRGEWHWHHYDKLVGAYAERGFKQMGLLAYSVGWANGGGSGTVFGPPGDLDAWEEFVRATVERYHDRVDAWEIWNEPDVAFFWNGIDGGQPDLYVELLRRAHRAIKSVDPDAIVVSGGVSGTGRGAQFIQRMLDLGGGQYFDALGVHGYVPEGEIDNDGFRSFHWPQLRAARERAGKPFWVTEFGWASGDVGGEAAQANLIARHGPMLFDLGHVERIFVFQFKDPGNVPDYYGLVRSDGAKKPAFNAAATFAARTAGLRFERRVELGVDDVWSMRFSNAERTVDVVWSQSDSRTFTFPTASASATLWRMDGGSETLHGLSGGFSLTVGAEPVIVERAGQSPAAGNAGCQAFSETGQTLCDGFLHYWERYGGLSIFGYPISPQLQENGLTVQYLERAKLEYHPEAIGTEWVIVGELLGRTVTAGREHEGPFLPLANPTSDSNCTAFHETGHRLCGGFRAYWEQHGGLWMFGYPITEEFHEDGYIVQYFERARFEWHPENEGTPYAVLLGHLGRELYERRY